MQFMKYWKKNIFRYLRGSNWNVDVSYDLLRASCYQARDYYPYMSAGLPSDLDHVWQENLLSVSEERDQHGRRIFILRYARSKVSIIHQNKILDLVSGIQAKLVVLSSSQQPSPCLRWLLWRRRLRLLGSHSLQTSPASASHISDTSALMNSSVSATSWPELSQFG